MEIIYGSRKTFALSRLSSEMEPLPSTFKRDVRIKGHSFNSTQNKTM